MVVPFLMQKSFLLWNKAAWRLSPGGHAVWLPVTRKTILSRLKTAFIKDSSEAFVTTMHQGIAICKTMDDRKASNG